MGASLVVVCLLAGGARGAREPSEATTGEEVESFLRQESARLTGQAEPKRKSVGATPERAPRRILLADIPVKPAGWIPDVDRHAAAAYTEAVREDARQLTLSGRHGQAIAELEKLTVAGEGTDKVLKDVGDYSYRVADYERSGAILKKMLETNPENPEVLCNLSAVLLEQGQGGEALELLERIRLWEVGKPALAAAVLFNRACAYSSLGRTEEAVAAVYAAYKAHPKALSLWMTDGQLDGIRGDPRIVIVQNAARGAWRSSPPAPPAGLSLSSLPASWAAKRAETPGRLALQGW
ncbi:MAG TPA: tetratricopeptide repeat protein [Kiritimatiellia bacterium]|nr:tetratricopeptide repeat protein [Kiritimatiellia bacterium]HSA19387.1 tetratricopeptide repeat protein [Kiritimatiellia bacterium]